MQRGIPAMERSGGNTGQTSVIRSKFIIYYNLWHTITEANGCNAKESRTPYYSRTPKVQKTKPKKKIIQIQY